MRRKKSEKVKIAEENDRIWSLIVKKRANYKCERCGKETNRLEAHHIFSRVNKATRWETHNGLGLCYYCHHMFFHRRPVESTEWVKHHIGMDTFTFLFDEAHKPVKYDLEFVKRWNHRLRTEFKQIFGISYEEWKRRHKK